MPSSKSMQKVIGISKMGKQKRDIIDIAAEYSDRVGKKLFKSLELDQTRRKEIEENLKRVGSSDTYERFMVKSIFFPIVIIASGFLIGQAIEDAPAASYIAKGSGLIIGFMMFFNPKFELNKMLKEKNDKLILEMPRFVRTYRYSPSTKGLSEIVSDYLKTAKEGLKFDLELLKADIEMIDEEKALKNFSDRIGIPEVSEFATVIQTAINNGKSEADMSLFFVESKFQAKMDAIIDKELKKRPEILQTVNDLLTHGIFIVLIVPMVIHAFSGIRGMIK